MQRFEDIRSLLNSQRYSIWRYWCLEDSKMWSSKTQIYQLPEVIKIQSLKIPSQYWFEDIKLKDIWFEDIQLRDIDTINF